MKMYFDVVVCLFCISNVAVEGPWQLRQDGLLNQDNDKITEDNFHKHLNKRDLKRIFNAEDPSDVAVGYELSYIQERTIRSKRDSTHNPEIHPTDKIVSIRTTTRTYTVYISTSHLIDDSVLQEHDALRQCLYTGQLISPSYQRGRVALIRCSGDKGYSGVVNTPEKLLTIEPVPGYLQDKMDHDHIVLMTDLQRPSVTSKRYKRQVALQSEYYAEMNLVADAQYFSEFGQFIRSRSILYHFTGVQGILWTLDPPVNLFVKNLTFTDRTTNTSTISYGPDKNIYYLARSFCEDQRFVPGIDISMFITGTDVVREGDAENNVRTIGVGYLGGVCDPKFRCGIIELYKGNSHPFTIMAHEIGHILGLKHPCGGIMKSPHVHEFNNCSDAEFQSFLESNPDKTCLNDFPQLRVDNQPRVDTLYNGWNVPLDAWCDSRIPLSRAHITDASPYNVPCTDLYCELDGLISQSDVPSFDGMRCDVTGDTIKICIGGMCTSTETTTTTSTTTTTTTTTQATRRRKRRRRA